MLINGPVIGRLRRLLWVPEMQAFRRDLRFQRIAVWLRLPDYWRRYGPPDGEVPSSCGWTRLAEGQGFGADAARAAANRKTTRSDDERVQ